MSSDPDAGDGSADDASDGYVHTPGAVDASDDAVRSDDAARSDDAVERGGDDAVGTIDEAGHVGSRDAVDGRAPTDAEEDLGTKGWLLVGVVVTATIVIPGLIYLFPAAPGEAGLPFLIAMLVLPFLPAVLLGLTAVWSMTAE